MEKEDFKCTGLDSVVLAKALRYAGKCKEFQFNKTQINKLLYIAYGLYLVRKRIRLTQEHLQAWPYGPVFPRIQKRINLYDEITEDEFNQQDEEIKNLLNEMVDNYGHFSAGTLSSWSHNDGSPWFLALERNNGKYGAEISDDDIYDFFYSFATAG